MNISLVILAVIGVALGIYGMATCKCCKKDNTNCCKCCK